MADDQGDKATRRGLFIAAAAFLAAAVAGWAVYERSIRRPALLLAQAYSAGRVFEWRLPDAGWSQATVRRSGSFDRPGSLFEAKALLSRRSSSLETDARWLDGEARADILDLQSEPAIARLQEAIAASPNSADLLSDLAAAYGVNAETFDRPAELAAVVEFTTRALSSDPRHRRALFNRALAFERLYMVDRAAEDWEEFLRIESDPGWLQEARSRLQRLKSMQEQRARLLQSDETSDAVLESKAVTWLKEDRARARGAGKAVLQAYGDRWLLDAAEEKVDSQLLVEAVNDVIAGRADDALQVGEKAVRLYHSAPAHLVRAQLEIVNALNRSMHSEECRARAESVAKGAEAPGYYWIQVQALLQVSSCSGMAGDIRTANEKRREGIRLAGQQRLASLQFRAIGLDTALRTRAGDLWAAWRENRDGLQRASASAVFRIHQSLVNYASATELWGWRAASYAFMKAAADTLHSTPNRITEAADRSRAAGLALEAHLKKEYAEETQKAKELFAALPDSPTRTRYLESVGLLEGKSYLMSNRPGEAVRVLTPVAQAVVLQTEQWQAHQFLGLSLLHTGRRTEAMRQLETAVATLEQRIAKLSRPAERSQARREGLEAYRTLAEALLDQDPSGAQSLRVWLSAHGSNAAPDLVFLEVADGYAVWTQQGARLHHLARDRSKIRSSVRRLLSAAGDPNRPMNEIQTEGRFLYQQLLPPEMGVNAADDVLTVLPDAEIAGIPFELLVGPDGRWMGDCIATVFATHPRNTTELWNPPRRALVIGAPATQELLPPLPESRLEAETIALHFPGSTLITGPRATASAVTLDLERSDLFHYSGHGYAGASVGGLYLSDSLLTSASLQGLSLPACRLAVLAACITAVGQTDGLTNPDSLVHALLDAGVRTAIASRWAVDSAATATLMSRFYPDLDATRDPAKSLANATRSLRADAKYSHPYFWAAFQTYE